MRGVYEADTKQLRDLASSFSHEAQALREASTALSSAVRNTVWRGGDAEHFKSRWQSSVHLPPMGLAAAAVEEAAAILRRNAEEQDRASGIDSKGTIGGFGGNSVAIFPHIPGLSPTREGVEAWWQGLTEEEQAVWLRDHPDMVGNREGIPLEARYEANQRLILREMKRISGESDLLERWASLNGLLRMTGADGSRLNILYFDPDNDYVAVVHGDLTSASEVAVTVGGTGRDIGGFAQRYGSEGALLMGEWENRAVITTLVWDAPPNIPANLVIDHFTPPFVNGPIGGIVETAAAQSDTVILVAHSAGVTAVQEFAIASDQAELVDGYALFVPPGLSDRFLENVEGRAVFVGLHTDDPIWATTILFSDHRANIEEAIAGEGQWGADNVSIGVKPSGAGVEGEARGKHASSLYFDNFEGHIDALFSDPAANPSSLGRLRF